MPTKVPGRKTIFSQSEQQKMIKLYESGHSIHKIALRFNLSYTATRNELLRLNVSMRLQARKYTIDHHAFDKIDNELAAYWLGFIYADGCVRNTYLQIVLGIKDKNHLKKILPFLGSNSPVSIYYDTPARAHLAVFSIHMTDMLRSYGILPKRPKTDLVLDAVPERMFHHWLRGFFDGDGSATKGKQVVFCGGKDLMEFIRLTLASKKERNPNLKLHPHRNIHYLRYKGYYNAHAVADYMYQDATVWLERKRNIIMNWKRPMSHSERAKIRWGK